MLNPAFDVTPAEYITAMITERGVKDHLHDVFEKMKIHHRSELAAKLLGFGLKPNR